MRSVADRVDNNQDIIDSRDIIERINDLEGELQDRHTEEREAWASDVHADGGADTDQGPEPTEDFEEWLKEQHDANDDDATELLTLRVLVEEIDNNAGDNARDGVGLIRDSYFEDYAREMAEDIGAIGRDAPWPACHIDWEAAAEALQQDYSTVDYDGVTYWVRC